MIWSAYGATLFVGVSATVLERVKRWVLAVLAMLAREERACAWLRAAPLPPPKETEGRRF
jgi:hypothetical protein